MFKVILDNGEDTGNLGVFETEAEAEAEGMNWLLEMRHIDPEHADEYAFDIEEVDVGYAGGRRMLGEELRWLDEMNRL